MRALSKLPREAPFLVFAVIIFALLLPVVIGQPWHIDLGMHLATLLRWDHAFTAPRNPLIDVPGPSPYYSPYMLVWVLLMKAFGLSQFTVLKIAAGLNVIILLIGFRAFVGSFTRSAAPVMISFLAWLLIWGWTSITWSGLFPLGTLLVTLPFPSTFATGCTLLLLALVRRTAVPSPADRSSLVLIILLSALIVLSHPITGFAAAIGAVIILAPVLVGERRWRPLLIWAGVGAAALLLTMVWPWFRVTDLLASPDGLDELHSTLYVNAWQRYGLLVLTVPALIERFRRNRWDPLPLLAAVNLALVLIGYATGHYALGRMITWAAIPAQVAVGLELWRALTGLRPRLRHWWRLVIIVSSLTALIIGARYQLGAIRSVFPEQTRSWPASITAPFELWGDFDWAARSMDYGDVVLTVDRHALRMIPAYGPYTVAPAYPDPLLPDAQPEREAVSEEFLDDDTDGQRRAEIVDSYAVDWVIASEKEWSAPDGPQAGIDYQRITTGPDGEVLYRVIRQDSTDPDRTSGG